MILNPITQRNLEAYEGELVKYAGVVMSNAKTNRLLIEAARAAGIATELPADLLDLHPRDVLEFSKQIASHKKAALEPLSGE